MSNDPPEDSDGDNLYTTQRAVCITALLLLIVGAWAFVLLGAGMHMSAFEMTRMEQAKMESVLTGGTMAHGDLPAGNNAKMEMQRPAWTAGTVVVMFFMWWVMMIAMMLPTIVPAVVRYSATEHLQDPPSRSYRSVAAFVLGYSLVWGGFSLAAVCLQWLLLKMGLLTPMIVSKSLSLDAWLLLAAGLYQFTPIQRKALLACRSCGGWMQAPDRQRLQGGLALGLGEGVRCLNTCWVLMLLLFMSGAMNLYWIGLLSMLVLLQKTMPRGDWFGYALGAVLVVWGVVEAGLAFGLFA
ncbi:MAG: DUF2182 domain-containing protein [Pseudomonadota bacterium]